VASWSSIDFFGHWKLLHHTVKEKFAPVIVAIAYLENEEHNIYVVNDLLHQVHGEILITYHDNTTLALPFSAQANASTLIIEHQKKKILKTELVTK
jgi:beta-mannosidase